MVAIGMVFIVTAEDRKKARTDRIFEKMAWLWTSEKVQRSIKWGIATTVSTVTVTHDDKGLRSLGIPRDVSATEEIYEA